ncbi:MAG: hypothetical protein JWP37_3513 [Mucilaginibacter sp.]|nr:hypothetical protein [Mucilaginibacter sp.]
MLLKIKANRKVISCVNPHITCINNQLIIIKIRKVAISLATFKTKSI